MKTKNTGWGIGYKGLGYVYQLGKEVGNMNLEKIQVCVPVFGEDRYMYAIQIMKRKRLCGTWVEGICATGGGADRGDMWL